MNSYHKTLNDRAARGRLNHPLEMTLCRCGAMVHLTWTNEGYKARCCGRKATGHAWREDNDGEEAQAQA